MATRRPEYLLMWMAEVMLLRHGSNPWMPIRAARSVLADYVCIMRMSNPCWPPSSTAAVAQWFVT